MVLSLKHFGDWLERYFAAWGNNDRQLLEGLFAEDAVYHYGPFNPPSSGRARIIEGWLSSPPPKEFRHTCTPIAVSGDTGVGQWNVLYRSNSKPNVTVEIDGILVIQFDKAGQCVEHKEWFVIREVPDAPY